MLHSTGHRGPPAPGRRGNANGAEGRHSQACWQQGGHKAADATGEDTENAFESFGCNHLGEDDKASEQCRQEGSYEHREKTYVALRERLQWYGYIGKCRPSCSSLHSTNGKHNIEFVCEINHMKKAFIQPVTSP